MWFLDLDAPVAPAMLAAVSTTESARCARTPRAVPRARALAARARVRDLLARYMGRAPSDLAFETQPKGKPRLVGASVPRFNLAHSGAAALLAVSALDEVGVDIEAIDPRNDLEELVTRACSGSERSRLQSMPAAERLAQVYRWWARKEALVKSSGEGFASDPREVCVCDLDRDGRLPLQTCSAAGANGVWLVDLDPVPLHAAALAFAGTPTHLRTCDATHLGPALPGCGQSYASAT